MRQPRGASHKKDPSQAQALYSTTRVNRIQELSSGHVDDDQPAIVDAAGELKPRDEVCSK